MVLIHWIAIDRRLRFSKHVARTNTFQHSAHSRLTSTLKKWLFKNKFIYILLEIIHIWSCFYMVLFHSVTYHTCTSKSTFPIIYFVPLNSIENSHLGENQNRLPAFAKQWSFIVQVAKLSIYLRNPWWLSDLTLCKYTYDSPIEIKLYIYIASKLNYKDCLCEYMLFFKGIIMTIDPSRRGYMEGFVFNPISKENKALYIFIWIS